MRKTKTEEEKKIPTSLNSHYKQNSSEFISKYYGKKRQCSPNVRFKKSCNIKPNLHQIKIEADSFCEEKIGDDTNESRILNELKEKDDSCLDFDQIRLKKSKSFKRELQIKSENKKVLNGEVRENLHILFKEGFLPDVKKFYSTYKNFDREQERENFFRHTLPCKEDEKNGSFRTIKFASHVLEEDIAPRKLGIVGRLSQEKVNQNSAHLTEKEYRTLAKGISLINVHKIELKNNKLSKENAKLLVENLPPKMEKINLKNSIPSKFTLELLNSETLKQGRLKKLNLSFNKITDIGLHCIQEVFNENLALEIVNLSNNLISDKSAHMIGNFITENENLRNLNLAWNKFTGKDMYKIFSAIESSKSLINVNLSRNTIGENLSQIVVENEKIRSKNEVENKKLASAPKNYSTLKSLCSLLQNNNYLLHFDMSYNKILSNDCEEIALSLNLFNETLVGFHFGGNSIYYSNEFGFLVKNEKFGEETESVGNVYFQGKRSVSIKSDDLFRDSIKFRKPSDCLDKCWLCLGWVTKQFTFEIDRKMILILETLKHPFITQKLQSDAIKNVYIHIECFNYQPVLMRCKKKIKSGINENILKSKNDILVKSLKKEPTLNLTNLNNSPKNETELINNDDEDLVVYEYSINLKIPPYKRFRYFFTIDGEPITDPKGQIESISESEAHVEFDIFNPFRDIWFKKMEKFKEESSGKSKILLNEQMNRAINIIQSLMGVMKESRPMVPHLKVFLTEFNIQPSDQQEKEDKTDNEKNKLQEICQKILSNDEEVTKEEYNLLIEERVRLEEIRNEISEKYISSERLIEEKQMMLYEDQNEESSFFVKPRFKDMFVSGTDPKTEREFDFCKFFRSFLELFDDPNNQKVSQNLSELLPKWENLQKESKFEIFYPLKSEKDSTIDFLNMIHYERLIHEGKVEIKPLTEEILNIGNFNVEKNQNTISFGSYQSKENNLLIVGSLKIILSKILPYALISYHNLKFQREQESQNQNEELSRMFSKTESRFKKSSRSREKTKRNKSAESKERNRSIKNEPKIKVSNESSENTEEEGQSVDRLTNEGESSISVKHSTPTKIKGELKRKKKMSNLISIDRIEEILLSETVSSSNELNVFDEFVQKLRVWKGKKFRLNDEEMKILTLYSQEIRTLIKEKVENVEKTYESSSKNLTKFNEKINNTSEIEASKSFGFEPKLKNVNLPKSSTIGTNQSFDYQNYELDGLKKEGENPGSKTISLYDQMGSINILEETELFLVYDENFQKCFLNQATDSSVVDFYVRKINKFLIKKEREESKLKEHSPERNKKKNKKSIEKKIILKSLEKSQKEKITLKSQTKNNILEDHVKQKDHQSKTEKNIFIFLEKEKENSTKYFSRQEKFSFVENEDNEVNMKQHILTRFDYIILNLVHNLGEVKKFECTLPQASKEILLKELLIFRCLLINSRKIAFYKHFEKLVEIGKDLKENKKSISLQFLENVQKVSFIGVVDLLYEHLLYVIYFVTKLTCFFILSDPKMLKTLTEKRENLFKNANPRKNIKQIIVEKDKKNSASPCCENIIQGGRLTLLDFIKDHPKNFKLELEKLMKSVLSDVLLTITNLHVHYDLEMKKEETENVKTSKLTETNQSESKDLPEIIEQLKPHRKSSFFSKTSEKTTSKEKKPVSEKKKKLIKELKKVSDLKESNGVLQDQKEIRLSNISEKKPKLEKKRPKLSLNLPKQTN